MLTVGDAEIFFELLNFQEAVLVKNWSEAWKKLLLCCQSPHLSTSFEACQSV